VELPIASTTIGMVTFSLLALTHLSVTIVKKDGHMSGMSYKERFQLEDLWIWYA
jgi:hypothetical protein